MKYQLSILDNSPLQPSKLVPLIPIIRHFALPYALKQQVYQIQKDLYLSFYYFKHVIRDWSELYNFLTLRAPALNSRPELFLPQATLVTTLQNACATLVD